MEWLRQYALCATAGLIMGWSPTNACKHKYDQKGLTTILTARKPTGFTPEVNLKNPLYENDRHTKRGSTLALKPWAEVTRSPKQGYQRHHINDLFF